jgi:hypothetical protein
VPVAPATALPLPLVAVPLTSEPVVELVPLWPAMSPLLVPAVLVPDDSCVAVAALHPAASNASNGKIALAQL